MIHLDEARRKAIDELIRITDAAPRSTKAVLIDDLFGCLRVILWSNKAKANDLRQEIDQSLRRECGQYWTGEIWLAQGDGKKIPEAERKLYEAARKEARPVGNHLLLLDRHRSRGAWFSYEEKSLWPIPREGTSTDAPPIVVFYSFKGGVGRSTALASFAIQRARRGERVIAIDGDFDAPGLGSLLSSDHGPSARWGVVDYLLERPRGPVDLRDYYHACRRDDVTGAGEILVVPAGSVDADYLGKLARIDLEPPDSQNSPHPLHQLLEQIRDDLAPHWILIDARAGLADPTGMLLGGLAHLHVLFGTFSDQSWAGLRLVIERLGSERIQLDHPQADCLLVQAMVPENVDSAKQTRKAFQDRAYDELSAVYYLEESEGQEDYWSVSDAASSDAPHVPIGLSYTPKLADFSAIDDVAEHLVEDLRYSQLAQRIAARFGGA